MKPARVPQTVVAPDCWGDLPWGELYRKALERQLNPWFTKMYGFHLLKIGNLSAEINCEACAVSHQVNVSAQGMPVQVQADPLHLPFADKSVDVCLLAHTLPWCTDPHRLLREADRVLIDDGWLVISGFNPISLMGLRKLVPVLRKTSPYNSRMFTLMRQLDWLSLLNFEVLHASRFHVLPWNKHGGKLLNAHIPCLLYTSLLDDKPYFTSCNCPSLQAIGQVLREAGSVNPRQICCFKSSIVSGFP